MKWDEQRDQAEKVPDPYSSEKVPDPNGTDKVGKYEPIRD